jgi:hypothetical protein|tara:strand:+ start:626 stop:1033 length:408 start_codon:yes stop_codon:yes gene_type:complete
MKIYFKSGYKYQLSEDYIFQISEDFNSVIYSSPYLEVNGFTIKMKRGYCSDGASFPAIDTKSFIRGAYEHDCLYQLIRQGVFPEHHRKLADQQLIKTCKEDGMMWARRKWVYHGLRVGGKKAASQKSIRKTRSAP